MLKILLFLSLLSIILGPALSLPLEIPGLNIYISDILIGLNAFYWLINFSTFFQLIKNDRLVKIFLLFVGISLVSLIITPLNLTLIEKFIALLYLLRLLAYFSVYLTVSSLLKQKVIKKELILKSLIFVGTVLSAVGWIQYFLYPDLRNLFYLGWDPHYKRIFSTFLDPNFFGLVLVLTFILLYTSSFPIFLPIFIFLTLLFTYSRSSFVALFTSVITYSFIKKKYFLILGMTIIITIGAFLLPRPGCEGVKLERIFSIEKRINSMKEGVKIFLDHPTLGVGFNTLRFAKREYGYISSDWQNNHAAAGVENSFIFLAATTGILGFVIYLWFLIEFFLKVSLLGKIVLVAIVTHSIFLNSLFFPPVMIWFWVICGCHSELVSESHLDPEINSG